MANRGSSKNHDRRLVKLLQHNTHALPPFPGMTQKFTQTNLERSHTLLLTRQQWLPRPLDDVFEFFSRPENLQLITPAWLDFQMVESPTNLGTGSLIRYWLRWRFIPIRWTTEITEWNPPHRFVDRAVSGPYALWNHEHSFVVHEAGTLMSDRVSYALPLGTVGWLAGGALVKRDVERIFDFRAETMRRLFSP
jgi:uncharacterized protein